MLYDIRKILCGTALSLVIGLGAATSSYAQVTLSLIDDELPEIGDSLDKGNNETIPDQIALFDDDTNNDLDEGTGLISPQAASSPKNVTIAEEEEDIDIIIPGNDTIYNSPATTRTVTPSSSSSSRLGDSILEQIDNELFDKMSDIEKQTSLLNLELRREKVKTEIEAIKSQRKKAEEEEKDLFEEKRRKQVEWEKEQEVKIIEAQKTLRETEFALEELRQENVLKAYKDSMLQKHIEWVASNSTFYKDYDELQKERDDLAQDFKVKLKQMITVAEKSKEEAKGAKENYDREINNLQSQISILKARLEAAEADKTANKSNPFAASFNPLETDENIRLSDEYAIMEIRGQGGQLHAKLVNKEERSFMVREGTVLQSGHIVDQITQTYLRADKAGKKDYIYFSAGGVVEREPAVNEVEEMVRANASDRAAAESSGGGQSSSSSSSRRRGLLTNEGVPSLSEGMMIK